MFSFFCILAGNYRSYRIGTMKIFTKKKAVTLWLLGILFCANSLAIYGQEDKWNLVWREDFGVAEDTIIKDFADLSNTVPGHCFIDKERFCNGQIQWDAASNSNVCMGFYDCKLPETANNGCGSIDDGFYGIANSTWWAYNRWARCGKSAGHFVAGRDHTGNKNGAMLIINSGVGEGDPIFSKKIEFNLCDSREYRFVIYVSSITAYGKDDPAEPSGGNANLEMNVTNITTGKVIKTIKTGDIPYWKAGDWSDLKPSAERSWSEYSCEFTANDGDVLELQITNWGSGYNDFAIDDISLYRKDTEEVPDPIISTNTIAQSGTTTDGCIYMAAFAVPEDVLPSWKKIYDNVYFLWQKSEDDGLTWSNIMDVSGIDKTSVEIEVNKDKPTVYRVIITGGSSESVAEEQALYIAENGAPKDGCAYYSISNTLAGVSPTPDCSFREDGRIVWTEDFGVIDSFSTRPYDGCALSFYETSADGFQKGNYVVTAAPDSSIKKIEQSWDGSFLNYSYKEKTLSDASGKPNGAMLYTYFGKASGSASEDILFSKKVDGPFCKCKNFSFSFQFYGFDEWGTKGLKVAILDDANDTLAISSVKIDNSNSRRWERCIVPFSLPTNYNGGVRLVIINTTPSDDWNYLSFDNFQISVCGESAPKASIQIDNNPAISYLGNFECEGEVHKVNIIDASEWERTYPDFGVAWQISSDGQTWEYLSAEQSVTYESSGAELLNYRAVFAETKDAAVQAARNGKPDDPCIIFGISNTVALKCKQVGCKAPVFEADGDDTLSICSDRINNVEITLKQKNKTNISEMQWYSSPADADSWTAIDGATYMTLSVLPSDSTDYLFIARNDTCFSDSIFARINVHKAIVFGELKDTMLCEGSDLTLEPVLKSGSPSDYVWNDANSQESSYTIEKADQNAKITFYATDGVCSSEEQTVNVTVEPIYQSPWTEFEMNYCEGTQFELKYPFASEEDSMQFASKYTSKWFINDEEYSNKYSESFDLSESSVIKQVITSLNVCDDVESSFNVNITKKPEVSLTADQDSVCLGSEVKFTASYTNVKESQWICIIDGEETVLSDKQDLFISVTPDKPASYYILVPESGCPAISSDTINIETEEPLAFDFADVPEKLCAGDEITLSATPSGGKHKNIQWKKNGTKVSEDFSFTDKPTEKTSYEFIAKGFHCADVTKEYSVNVEFSAELTVTSDKTIVCEGSDINLSATYSNAEFLEWQYSTDNVNFTAFSNEQVPSKTFEQKEMFHPTYFFRMMEVGSGLCPVAYSKTIEVDVEKILDANGTTDTTICTGSDITLSLNLDEEQLGSHKFTWLNGTTSVGSDATYTANGLTESQTFKLTAESDVCPSAEHTFNITVQQTPVLTLNTDKSNICEGESPVLSANYGTADKLTWFFSSDKKGSNASILSEELTSEQSVTPSVETKYWIEYPGNKICTQAISSDTVTIFVEKPNKSTISETPETICFGTSVTLSAVHTEGKSNDFEWLKNGASLNTSKGLSITDTPETNPTTYSLIIKGIYCKSDTQTVEIAVERSSELSLSASASALCKGEELTLSADYGDATSIDWEFSNDGKIYESFANDLVGTKTTKPGSSAHYRLKSAGNGVCPAVYSKSVSVKVEEPVRITLPEDTLICPNTSAAIHATIDGSPSKIVWESKTEGSDYSAIPHYGETVNVIPTATTYYRLTAVAEVCENASDEIIVSVDEVPAMDLSISTNGICKGEEVILTSNFKIDSNLRWWAKTANSNFTLVQEGGSEFSDTPEKQTTYKVTASSQAGCKAGELTESVNVFEPVTISVEDKKICEGESVSLSIEGLVKFSEITWTADGAIVGSDKTFAATPTSTTTYEISVKNGLCEGSAEATVEVVSAPKITAIEEVSNNTWQVEVNSEMQPVYFEYGAGSGTTTSNQFPIRYGTEYTVSVSNEIGCKTDTSFVTPTYDIRLPAAFSPNGDGIDDAFVIENIDKYPDAQIDIYDRFGKKLVTTSGANYEAWDGTYNGVPLPSADYWYEIYVHEINKEYIGHFTLIRQ